MTNLPARPGISPAFVTSIPDKWSKEWFRGFIANFLQYADTRNSTPGTGISITGNAQQPATISLTTEIGQLLHEPYALAVAPADAALTQYRTLVPEANVLTLTDGGPKTSLTIGVAPNGVGAAQFRQSLANTVVGNPTAAQANVQDITYPTLTGLLSVFTAGAQGVVPASGGGTTKFMRADGTWAIPAGSGGTVSVQDSISGDGSALTPLQLVNDTATPGNNYFYGTNASGARGWYAIGAGTSPLTTKGDIYTYTTTDARLPVGTDGYFLSADSTQTTGLKWVAAPTYTPPVTTKGDLFGYGAAAARVPVGSDGQVLTADSTQTLGLKWAATAAVNATSPYIYGTFTLPVMTGFALQHTGTTGTYTVDANGVVNLLNPAGSGSDQMYLVKSYANGNFDVRVCFTQEVVSTSPGFWFLVRDSSTGHAMSFGSLFAGNGNYGCLSLTSSAGAWSSTTNPTYSSEPGSYGASVGYLNTFLSPLWVRLTRVGNVYSMYLSVTGLFWEQLGSGITSTYAATPNEFAIGWNTAGGLLRLLSLSGTPT